MAILLQTSMAGLPGIFTFTRRSSRVILGVNSREDPSVPKVVGDDTKWWNPTLFTTSNVMGFNFFCISRVKVKSVLYFITGYILQVVSVKPSIGKKI